MVRVIDIVLLTIVIFLFQCNGEIALATAATTVSIAISAARLALKMWEHLQDHNASFLRELKELSENNDLLRTEILIMKTEIVDSVTETVPELVELNRRFALVFDKSSSIERSYKDFLLYVEEPENYDAKILNVFALQAISEDKGINHLLEEIHTSVVLSDTTSPSILRLLIKHIEKYLQYNNISKSPQQLIYDYLNSIINTEVKGLLTIQFSYRLLEMYQGGNYQGHIDKAEHDFIIRINNTVSVFKEFMKVVSQELWKNDPAKHREDITYTELKKLFQEMVVNEYDISTSDGCFHECFNYKVPSRKRHTYEEVIKKCEYDDDICRKQRVCSGYLYNCRKQIDTDMYICPSDQKSRRYEFIDYGNQHRYGLRHEVCNNDLVQVTRHYRYGIFRYCDACMCICDDDSTSDSDRYFNLVPSMAEINDNYVITGVRLRKQINIIHIQIQQGQLLSNGRINRTTIAWMPIDWNWASTHKLTWNESREINLDDLQLPKNHVLTGLSFTTKISHGDHKRLHLQIFSMPIDFESGKLLHDYKLNLTSNSSKSEILLHDLDIPTRDTVKNNIRSNSDQYLKFGPTGLHLDVGQSTIPFIDIQEVTTNPPVPMSGAGIYHKSKSGSAGFMGLKLFTYDFGQHVEANLPETYSSTKRSQTTGLQWFLEAQQLKSSASAVSINFSINLLGNIFLLMFIAVLYVP